MLQLVTARVGPAPSLLLAGVLLLCAASVRAEPYFAQREGYKCSRCHVNRTGGGKRTPFGYQYGLTHLAMVAGWESAASSDEPVEGQEPGAQAPRPWGTAPLDPNLSEHLSIGANVRGTSRTAFAKRVRNTFANPEANLYVQANALQGVSMYVDASVAEGSVEAREAFLMLSGASGWHAKAGYFLLPYGLRIWGDEEFIRQLSGYTFAAPDLGLELGYERGPLSLFAAVSNGSGGGLDSDNDKKVSLLAELSGRWLRLAWSGSFNRTRTQVNWLTGTYVGATLGRLSLLAEVDLVRTHYRAARSSVDSAIAYAEGNLLLARGINFKVGYGYHDPALDVAEDQRIHIRSSLDFFVLPFLATSVAYDVRQSVPQDEIGNADLLLAELHLYL